MSNSFSATFTGSATDVVAKAKGAIEKAGGTFDGDDSAGVFTVTTPLGAVKGTYKVVAPSFTVVITDKPFLLPASTIESQVRQFLAT